MPFVHEFSSKVSLRDSIIQIKTGLTYLSDLYFFQDDKLLIDLDNSQNNQLFQASEFASI